MTVRPMTTAALAALLAGGCNPNTNRPAITPSPGALTVLIARDPEEAIGLLADRLKGDSIPLARVEVKDAYLETPWLDSLGHVTRARPIGTDVIRLRAWADPAKVGSSTITVELSWRPFADPSVPERELDRDLPATSPLAKRIGAVLAAVKKEYGG